VEDKPSGEPASTDPGCPQCGANTLPEHRYCPSCGAQLPGVATAATGAVPETPVAAVEPARAGQELRVSKKSWWGRRGPRARLGLVSGGVVVLALVALGVLVSQGLLRSDDDQGLPPLEAELVHKLATAKDDVTRGKAALALADQFSVEAIRVLASKAESSDTARLGLEALRDVHVTGLTLLRQKYVALAGAAPGDAEGLGKIADGLTQTVDCLAVIGDAPSIDALGAFVRSGEAELADQRVYAVQVVAGMDPELAVPHLREAAELRGYPGRKIAEAAAARLSEIAGGEPATTVSLVGTNPSAAPSTTAVTASPTTTAPGNVFSDGILGIALDRVERHATFPSEFDKAVKESYSTLSATRATGSGSSSLLGGPNEALKPGLEFVYVYLDISYIREAHAGYLMIGGSKDRERILSKLIDSNGGEYKEWSFQAYDVTFADKTSFTDSYELVQGTSMVLVFQIPGSSEPAKLQFKYPRSTSPLWKGWSDKSICEWSTVEIGL
jgi:hypothetical protein